MKSVQPRRPRSFFKLSRLQLKLAIGLAVLYLAQSFVFRPSRHTTGTSSTFSTDDDAVVERLRADLAEEFENIIPVRDGHVRKPRLVIAEHQGQHDEVLAALIYAAKALADRRQLNFDVYRKGRAFRYRLDQVLEGIYDSDLLQDVELLESDLKTDSSPEQIDYLVLASCDKEIAYATEHFLRVWNARETKFSLVCVLHSTASLKKMLPSLSSWLERDSISFVTLADHVQEEARSILKKQGIDQSLHMATLAPVFPYDMGLDPLSKRSHPNKHRRVRKAVVHALPASLLEGYIDLLPQLEFEIEQDPEFWGYQAREGYEPYEADPACDDPFTVSLIGGGEFELPEALLNVASRKGVGYMTLYEQLHSADLLIAPYSAPKYTHTTASAAIHAAIIGHVPVLVTEEVRSSYPFLDEKNSILNPKDVSPIEAIKRLRANGTTYVQTNPNGISADSLAASYAWPKTEASMAVARLQLYQQNLEGLASALRMEFFNAERRLR